MHPVQTANRNYCRRDAAALRWRREETAERRRLPIGFAQCGVTVRRASVSRAAVRRSRNSRIAVRGRNHVENASERFCGRSVLRYYGAHELREARGPFHTVFH